MQTIEKYFDNTPLNNAEKKALYTSITKKINALESLYKEKEDYFIKGEEHIIPDRIKQAKEIIKQYKEKVFVAGSFLFSERYNDIDIYIIGKRGYKEEFIANKHIIRLTEKILQQPIFQSAALISISNFNNIQKQNIPSIFLHQLMSLYHEAVIEVIQNEKKKEALRDLIFQHNLRCKHKLTNAIELNNLVINTSIKELDRIFSDLCKNLFSTKYLYVAIHEYIKTLTNSIKNIKQNQHLIHYKDIYEEMIYGHKRSKSKAY